MCDKCPSIDEKMIDHYLKLIKNELLELPEAEKTILLGAMVGLFWNPSSTTQEEETMYLQSTVFLSSIGTRVLTELIERKERREILAETPPGDAG